MDIHGYRINDWRCGLEYDSEFLSRVMKSKRMARGWTQFDLAEASGVSAGVISDYERCAVKPQFPTLVKLASSLGCSTDDFVKHKGAEVQ